MPDDLERLQRKIEEGLEAVRELRKLDAERKKQNRPKLKLIKGGMISGAILAGVEWLRDYRRTAGTLVLSGLTVTGAVIAEQPGSPGSDPPQAIKPPASVRPSTPPPARPTATPAPRRTSLPRSQVPMRISPPAEPASSRPTARPKERTTVKPIPSPLPGPPSPGKPKPTVSLPVTPTVTPSVTPSVPAKTTPTPCAINVLGVRVCLPLG